MLRHFSRCKYLFNKGLGFCRLYRNVHTELDRHFPTNSDVQRNILKQQDPFKKNNYARFTFYKKSYIPYKRRLVVRLSLRLYLCPSMHSSITFLYTPKMEFIFRSKVGPSSGCPPISIYVHLCVRLSRFSILLNRWP